MTQTRDDYLGLVGAGWTMAFVLPIGGIVTGLVLVDRRAGHAAGMLAVSGLVLLGLFALIVVNLI